VLISTPKQQYQPAQIGITQNTKTTEMAARTPAPNQTIIENVQNETDILQTSLSEKERLLNIKENQTTKMETEVTHLKNQLSTNRSSLPYLSFLCSALYRFVWVDMVGLVELLC
jgi:cob(I)alamin adenosyltransferase